MPRRSFKRGTQGVNGSNALPSPPAFTAAIVVRKTFRFQSNAAFTATNVTAVNLLDLLCMADTAVTAYRLASAVRVRRVSLWAPMSSSLAPVTASVEWAGYAVATVGAPPITKSDTSMGYRPAYVTDSPPTNSIAGMWQGRASTSNLMQIAGPINTVIDVDLEFVLQNGEPPLAVANAPAGATVGTVYLRGLDGLAAAATVFPAISYNTA